MTEEIKQILQSHGEQIDFIAKKAVEHDEHLNKIAKKVVEHDEKLDKIAKKVVEHDEKLDKIAKKVVEHDEQLDKITRTVVDHTERLDRIEENMATKDDIRGLSGTLDELVGLAKKKDEELTMMGHGARRREERIRVLEGDMKKVKSAVEIA